MKKIIRYNSYLLVILLSSIFMLKSVEAEESSATCIYYFGTGAKLKYNISATKYDTNHTIKMQGASISDEVTKGDFIDENDQFFCPKIYYSVGMNGRSSVYYLGRYKADNLVLEPSDESKINNIADNKTNIQMCVYEQATFTVDTEKKEIVSYTAINCDSLSNGYTYEQIYGDGKCLLTSVNTIRTADRSGKVTCALTPNTNILGSNNSNTDETFEKYPDQEEDNKYNGEVFCGIFGENTFDFIKSLYTIVKILIPVLVIVLGIIDFLKVVFSGEEKDMKAAGTRFLKRILAGIIFILLPALLEFLMSIVGFPENCIQQLIK